MLLQPFQSKLQVQHNWSVPKAGLRCFHFHHPTIHLKPFMSSLPLNERPWRNSTTFIACTSTVLPYHSYEQDHHSIRRAGLLVWAGFPTSQRHMPSFHRKRYCTLLKHTESLPNITNPPSSNHHQQPSTLTKLEFVDASCCQVGNIPCLSSTLDDIPWPTCGRFFDHSTRKASSQRISLFDPPST